MSSSQGAEYDASKTLPELAVDVASTQVGVREVGGNNRGPEVEAYQRRGGGWPGLAWCGFFIYWCYDVAASIKNVVNPLERTGACWKQLRKATLPGSRFRVIVPTMMLGSRTTVRAGDVAIHARKATKRDLVGAVFKGHEEIVTDDRGSTYGSIGGNTSCGTGTQYDGDGVCNKERRKVGGDLPVVAFLRYTG